MTYTQTRRLLSDVSTQTPQKTSSGASLFQRVSSFAVGAGLSALVTQYYLFTEIRNGNKQMINKQKELEARIKKLEK